MTVDKMTLYKITVDFHFSVNIITIDRVTLDEITRQNYFT